MVKEAITQPAPDQETLALESTYLAHERTLMRDEHLPTVHGFHEFYGSLYHLNAEQEPEHPDYFKDPELQKKYGTREVLHTRANPDGTQKIELTGSPQYQAYGDRG